jgi:hypothetical protein
MKLREFSAQYIESLGVVVSICYRPERILELSYCLIPHHLSRLPSLSVKLG